MLYLDNEVKREAVVREEERPGGPPANGGMPSFGGTFGMGMWIGIVGGAACNLVLMTIVAAGSVLGALSYGISLGEAVGALIWAVIFIVVGTLVASPIGMVIGGISATLMWLALGLLPKRDERTRMIVGVVCAGVVSICAVIIALNLLADPYRSSVYDIYVNSLLVVLVPEAIAVTVTGGWFAGRYLGEK